MDRKELRVLLTEILQSMYDMEVFSSLMEFCQGELRVLIYLNANLESDVFPSDLSQVLFVTRQRVTTILSSLRKKGFISMELSENDRRRMRIFLTEPGKVYVNIKKEMVDDYLDRYIEKLGTENITELIRLLRLTMDKMGDAKIR